MKLSGSTHMTILFSFALVFVVIYLYYTINDVKKMHGDIKKVQSDVQTLTTTLNKLSTDVTELQKMSTDVGKVFNMNEMLSQELNSLFNSHPQFIQIDPASVAVPPGACDADICARPGKQTTNVVADDDADSVDTNDIKKMLNDDDTESTDELLGKDGSGDAVPMVSSSLTSNEVDEAPKDPLPMIEKPVKKTSRKKT